MKIKDLPKIHTVLKSERSTSDFVVIGYSEFRTFIRKLALEGEINETVYLARYADVAEAVKAGKVKSATEHYIRSGYLEGRKAQLKVPAPAPAPGKSPSEPGPNIYALGRSAR